MVMPTKVCTLGPPDVYIGRTAAQLQRLLVVAHVESNDGEKTGVILHRHLASRVGVVVLADGLWKHHVSAPVVAACCSKAHFQFSGRKPCAVNPTRNSTE